MPRLQWENLPKEVISARRGGLEHQEPEPQPQRLVEEIHGQKSTGAQQGGAASTWERDGMPSGCGLGCQERGGLLGLLFQQLLHLACWTGGVWEAFIAQSEGLGSNWRLIPQVSFAETAWQDAVSQVHREQKASDTETGAAPVLCVAAGQGQQAVLGCCSPGIWDWRPLGAAPRVPHSYHGRGLRPPQGPRWLQRVPLVLLPSSAQVPAAWECCRGSGCSRAFSSLFSHLFLQIIFLPRP